MTTMTSKNKAALEALGLAFLKVTEKGNIHFLILTATDQDYNMVVWNPEAGTIRVRSFEQTRNGKRLIGFEIYKAVRVTNVNRFTELMSEWRGWNS